jgi:3-hydroxyisobutyrate dehydrogenase
MRVGFVGLGAMGRPMAARLAGPYETVVWNRTAAVAAEHAARYGSVAGSLAEAVSAPVVVSCLSDSPAVGEVIDAGAGWLRPGAVWIDCTSGDPAASRALAERLARVGVDYLDAPVSGMAHGARDGTLTILVGGAAEVLDRVRPVLAVLGSTVVHVGGTGTGHLVKAANNTLFATAFWATAEVFAMLEGTGIEASVALTALNASSGRSYLTEQFLTAFVRPGGAESSYRLGQNVHNVETLLRGCGEARMSAIADVARRYRRLVEQVGPSAGAVESFAAIGRTMDYVEQALD